jgi:riboflavin kinase/FMN adenylyltransferase
MPEHTGSLVAAEHRGGAVAIGNFDGVHRGHRTMIDRLVAGARQAGRAAVVVTFDPHPLSLLRREQAPPPLTTIAHRTELLRGLGVDAVVVLPTTHELLHWTPAEFFERVVLGELQARCLVEGPNFCFGRDRTGNIEVLRGLCAAHGIALEVIEPVTIDGQWVSSSAIRTLLLAGEVDSAVQMLGHPYRLSGRVVSGAVRGRTLGFPTANLDDCRTVIPGSGVYAGQCWARERCFAAAIHIGPNLTFAEHHGKVEVHLLDFSGDLYGQWLHVDLLARIRGVQRFASLDALRQQLAEDVERVRRLCGSSAATGPTATS